MKKIVLAYSGGLDTTFCALHLSKELGYEVHAVLVNTGGFSKEELKDIEERAKGLGVASFTTLHGLWQRAKKPNISAFCICRAYSSS